MKVLSIVGARPQFVKLAPIAAALEAGGHDHVIVHTGQHYDARCRTSSSPTCRSPHRTSTSASAPARTASRPAAMLAAMDAVLDEHSPDWVLVYGDTNSTLAGALSAVKLHLPLAHLEAGLRSFNRRMPEEHNRVLTDHAADLLPGPDRRRHGAPGRRGPRRRAPSSSATS